MYKEFTIFVVNKRKMILIMKPTVRQLTPHDKEAFMQMNKDTFYKQMDPSFFIPFTEIEIEKDFSPEAKDILLGIFEKDQLVAVSGLLYDLSDFYDLPELQGYDFQQMAEIGGCMTSPRHRNNGYMRMINENILKTAQQQQLRYLVATAHPDNIPSNSSLQRLGMKWFGHFQRHNYPRNLYFLDLEEQA